MLICRHFCILGAADLLLAMQKVEGLNPFSRFEKGGHLEAFFVVAVEQCVCVTGQ
jgi:hypothetical protein